MMKKEEEAAKKEKNLRPIGEGAHQDPKAVKQRTTHIIEGIFISCLAIKKTHSILQNRFSPTVFWPSIKVMSISFMNAVDPVFWPLANKLNTGVETFSSKSACGVALLPLDLHLDNIEDELKATCHFV